MLTYGDGTSEDSSSDERVDDDPNQVDIVIIGKEFDTGKHNSLWNFCVVYYLCCALLQWDILVGVAFCARKLFVLRASTALSQSHPARGPGNLEPVPQDMRYQGIVDQYQGSPHFDPLPPFEP